MGADKVADGNPTLVPSLLLRLSPIAQVESPKRLRGRGASRGHCSPHFGGMRGHAARGEARPQMAAAARPKSGRDGPKGGGRDPSGLFLLKFEAAPPQPHRARPFGRDGTGLCPPSPKITPSTSGPGRTGAGRGRPRGICMGSSSLPSTPTPNPGAPQPPPLLVGPPWAAGG